jgi:ubiquinone/menaquinone biosynthesis C-methylase UbiE
VLKHCFGENFSAPVHDLLSRSVSVARDSNTAMDSVSPQFNKNTPARVLDVACGSGVWVLEMATSFPNTQFYGIDFACIYPTTIKPPNTTFQQCDVLDPEGLPFPDEFFDYIHMRLVYNCFSKSDLKVCFCLFII